MFSPVRTAVLLSLCASLCALNTACKGDDRTSGISPPTAATAASVLSDRCVAVRTMVAGLAIQDLIQVIRKHQDELTSMEQRGQFLDCYKAMHEAQPKDVVSLYAYARMLNKMSRNTEAVRLVANSKGEPLIRQLLMGIDPKELGQSPLADLLAKRCDFVGQEATLWVVVAKSNYYNYQYRDAAGSHYAFTISDSKTDTTAYARKDASFTRTLVAGLDKHKQSSFPQFQAKVRITVDGQRIGDKDRANTCGSSNSMFEILDVSEISSPDL